MKKTIKNISTLLLPVCFVISVNSSAQDSHSSSPMPHIAPGLSVIPMNKIQAPGHIKRLFLRQSKEMKTRGYADATDDEVLGLDDDTLKKNKKNIKKFDEVVTDLAISPSDLNNGPFNRGRLIGAVKAGGHTDLGWTGITRFYTFPKLGLVKFDEIDLLATGGGVTVAEELINENINGSPAIFVVKQAVNGKTLTELAWFTQTKMFTLSTTKKMAKGDKFYVSLIDLANSIH